MLGMCLEDGAGNRFSECLEDGAGNRCSECAIRTVPESDVRSVEESAGSRCSEFGISLLC